MGADYLTDTRIVERIKYILDTKTSLSEKEDGTYECEIYADYRDMLGKDSIEKIFDSKNPREEFDDLISGIYTDTGWEYKQNVIDTVEKYFDDNDEGIYYRDHEEFIQSWIDEHVYHNYPYKHYLSQDVYIDIIVDTGDGNYDFTKNELFGCRFSEKGLKENSSVIWLMKQQGYTESQIVNFIENEDFQGSKLLESIYDECLNTSTCMNALSFFVILTVEECFSLYDALNGKEKNEKTMVISTETPCGLYDPWNGAGSILEIELEKEVTLPLQYVDSASPDGCRGYGISAIYGIGRSFWKSDCIKIA